MLSKNKRLIREHYKLSYYQRQSSQTPHLSMRVVSLHEPDTPSRFAFIVSKKITKSAVDRNKLRRRGYSSIEKIIKNIIPGKGVMIQYRKSSLQCTYKQIETEVHTLLHDAKMLINDKKNTY